jgi:hypothetical protein
MSSLINEPVTQNYIYQTLITVLTNEKAILRNGITPKTEIFLQYKNKNYNILSNNGFKYCFVYNFDLTDFINPTEDSIKNAEVISHEQMELNFEATLSYINSYQYYIKEVYRSFGGLSKQLMRKPIYKTATVGYLYSSPFSKALHSQQYGTNGITLENYMDSVIKALPGIVSQCPVNMNNVQDYFPENYVTEYTYTDLQGNTTIKTASFTAIKYTTQNGTQKVLFFGTGLQEYIVQ